MSDEGVPGSRLKRLNKFHMLQQRLTSTNCQVVTWKINKHSRENWLRKKWWNRLLLVGYQLMYTNVDGMNSRCLVELPQHFLS